MNVDHARALIAHSWNRFANDIDRARGPRSRRRLLQSAGDTVTGHRVETNDAGLPHGYLSARIVGAGLEAVLPPLPRGHTAADRRRWADRATASLSGRCPSCSGIAGHPPVESLEAVDFAERVGRMADRLEALDRPLAPRETDEPLVHERDCPIGSPFASTPTALVGGGGR